MYMYHLFIDTDSGSSHKQELATYRYWNVVGSQLTADVKPRSHMPPTYLRQPICDSHQLRIANYVLIKYFHCRHSRKTTEVPAKLNSSQRDCVKTCNDPRGGAQKRFIRGGSAPRSNPLPFYITFFQKRHPFRIPFIGKRHPFHIPVTGPPYE